MHRPRVVSVPLDKLDAPEQILRLVIDPDRTRELADSLQRTGQLQPILVRKVGDHFRIVAGHRRTLAARMLEWTHITAIEVTANEIPDVMLSLAENTAREELTPLEEAMVIHDLVVTQGRDLDHVAKMFGHSRQWAESRLDLYELPKEIREAIHQGKLALNVGKELARITDPGYREEMVHYAVANGCTLKVAMLWHQEWESRGRPTVAQDSEGDYPAIYQAPPAAGLECSSCGRLTSLTDLRTLHVCFRCLTPKQEEKPS